MKALLKSKGLWQCTKVSFPDPSNAQEKFPVDGKKDEAVGVIMTYILHEIWFLTSGIECPHEFRKKLKSLFDKVDES